MALSNEAVEFAEWMAEPRAVKLEKRKSDSTYPITQKEFAAKAKVTEKTLCQWKKDKRVQKLKREAQKNFAGDSLPEVIEALKLRAEEGDPASIKLYLQYMGELIEKHQIGVSEDDLEVFALSVIDIIHKHVKDPMLRNAIAREIKELEI